MMKRVLNRVIMVISVQSTFAPPVKPWTEDQTRKREAFDEAVRESGYIPSDFESRGEFLHRECCWCEAHHVGREDGQQTWQILKKVGPQNIWGWVEQTFCGANYGTHCSQAEKRRKEFMEAETSYTEYVNPVKGFNVVVNEDYFARP